ncbi:MAG: LLM class flavin-dependent oxidoreductase [Candidatus Binataceae bacterium]|jgi:alkanesulfonate monooxygenase SsuD/methylene tetrahydromethanopterin reductase-like flavin-dependent oxidoreductase (luciferase family)
MRFGVGPYTMQLPQGAKNTHADLYREMLDQIAIVEDLGYDSVWLAEHHFLADGICPSLLVTAAAMAARTKRLKIVTGMYLLPLHRPVQSAEDAAVVDNIAAGRLIFGVAAGYRPEEFAGHGEERFGREKRMEEELDIIIKAWTTDSFAYSGKYYQFPEMSVNPKPHRKPHPPIWFGASTKGGFRRAAKWGSALVASPRHHINELKEHFKVYRDYLREYGKQADEVPVIREVYVAETTAKAEAEARDGIMYLHAGMYGKWSAVRPLRDDKGELVKDPSAVTFESHRERFIIGDPDHCIREIEKYKNGIGMDHLVCWTQYPGLDPRKAENSLRLFAKEVMPHFKK